MFAKILHFAFIYSIGILWTSLVILRTLFIIIRKPRKFFYSKKRENRPQCLSDHSLGTHAFVRLENIRIHYVVNGPEDKPLMLLLHGFPESWYSWRHQLKEFSRDYRVVAIDTRGYGETDKPGAISDYKVNKLVEDVHQLIPALGYKRCVLVGHDWGGIMAWATAIKYPDTVDQLIIMNAPHPYVFGKYMRTHWKQFMKSWYMFFFNMPYIPECIIRSGDFKMFDNMFCGKGMGCKPGTITQEDLEAFKYEFREPGSLTPAVNYIRASIRTTANDTRLAVPSSKGYIDKPVLIIWGKNDGALELEMAELSQKYCSDFRLELVEGASHWVQQDDPQKVNEIMERFLNEKRKS